MGHIAIGVGLGGFPAGLPEPDALLDYVDRVDALGIDSIWLPDHPISEAAEPDSEVLLSAVAARTTDVKMGPSVLTLPARNPVAVANRYATLDYLTGGDGRVILGLGLGADPRLCSAVGVPAEERADRLREGLAVLRRLWTEDDVDYDGKFYSLDGVTVEPKPANGPLDVWIGGNSDAALRRVAEYGDGWFPAGIPPRTFAAKLERLMAYCDEAGRQVEGDEAGVIVPTYVADDPDEVASARERYRDSLEEPPPAETIGEFTAFGTPDACVRTIQGYVDAGCTKFVLTPVCPVAERVEQLERFTTDVMSSFKAD